MGLRRELLVGIPQGALIDVETTAIRPDEGDLISFGYIAGTSLVILNRSTESAEEYNRTLRGVVKDLPKPLYAFNIQFERDWIWAKLGIRIEGLDLFAPWARQAEAKGLKWPKLDELVSEPEVYFDEPLYSGRDVPTLWKVYRMTGNEELLDLIVRHNQSDLLRELYLLIHYPEKVA
jgi:hypothetical protein